MDAAQHGASRCLVCLSQKPNSDDIGAVHIFDLSAAWHTSQSCLFHGKAPASPHQSGLRRHGRRSRRFSALSMVTVQAATERHLVVTCSHIEELRN